MLSPRRAGRGLLAQLVARILIAALVLGSLPTPLQASLPSPGALTAAPPDLPLSESVPPPQLLAVAVTAAGDAEPEPCALVLLVADPHLPSKYHRARWMDPRVGRFLGTDLWDGDPYTPQTLHKYLYADGAPTWKVDPSGRFSLAVAITIVAVIAIVAAIAIPHLGIGKRSRTVAVKWSTDFVFGRARLSTPEKQRVKDKAHATARTAFAGLPLVVREGAVGNHRLEVVNVPSSFKDWGGITRGTSESLVFYSPIEEDARGYGLRAGLLRDATLEGLGQGLGVVIAHETAHQILWGTPDQKFTDHRDDPATYDHYGSNFNTFYAALSWSAPTRAALDSRLR